MNKFRIKGNVADRLRSWEKTVPSVMPSLPAVPVRGSNPVTRTDVGKLRRNNQDTVICACGLMGIADGMGGHNGGETASAGARDIVVAMVRDCLPSAETLRQAVSEANIRLFRQQNEDPLLSGMGTTLTLLWPTEDEVLIAHVGDSRAYLLRDGVLTQRTEDHSMVGELVRKGILTPAQAASHPMRNYITRAVGTEETIETDLLSEKRQKGDRWLVCSDGLHGLVQHDDLTRLLALPDADQAADALLNAALENGGRDNISLLIWTDEEGGAV